MEASNRPKQAQHLPISRKVQNGNTRVHQGLSDSREMGVVFRPVRHLHSHPHPPSLKEVPTVLPRFSSVPVHLPPFQPSHGPTSLYNGYKGSEADGPHKGSQTSPIAEQLAYQGPVEEEAQAKTQDCDRPNTVRRVENQSREVQTQTHSGVFIRGLLIRCRFSPCTTHSREMAQTSGFDPTL